MHRWLLTLLAVSLMGLCAAFLVLRWWQLAARAPEDVERLKLAPVLAARAQDALPAARDAPAAKAKPASTAPPAPSAAKTAAAPAPAGPVNINTATAQQLATLPGIGEVLAARIVAYRKEHGPFASVDGLLEVEGIGAGKLAKLKPKATTGK